MRGILFLELIGMYILKSKKYLEYMYECGIGTNADLSETLYCYNKADKQGYSEAKLKHDIY